MIESSLAKQYGIKINDLADMPWPQASIMISGLMHDTPLGSIVAIRAETDPKTIKGFSAEQKKIHTDWKLRAAKERKSDPAKLDQDFDALAAMLRSMFSTT